VTSAFATKGAVVTAAAGAANEAAPTINKSRRENLKSPELRMPTILSPLRYRAISFPNADREPRLRTAPIARGNDRVAFGQCGDPGTVGFGTVSADRTSGKTRRDHPDHRAFRRNQPVACAGKALPLYPDIKVELAIDYGLTDIVAERHDASSKGHDRGADRTGFFAWRWSARRSIWNAGSHGARLHHHPARA
jgi:hypothetical protein